MGGVAPGVGDYSVGQLQRSIYSSTVSAHPTGYVRRAVLASPESVAAEGGYTQDVMHRHYANLRIPPLHVTAFWRIGP